MTVLELLSYLGQHDLNEPVFIMENGQIRLLQKEDLNYEQFRFHETKITQFSEGIVIGPLVID